MTASNAVPSSFTTRWSAHTHQPLQNTALSTSSTSSSTTTGISHLPKYNTSCNSCRKSRVKCSGGVPCQRCATSSNPPLCIYSISQRRGKRKATEDLSHSPDFTVQGLSPGVPHLNTRPTFEFMAHNDQIGSAGAVFTSMGEPASNVSGAIVSYSLQRRQLIEVGLTADSPSLTELVGSLNSPPPPQSSSPKERQKCPDGCYASIHDLANSFNNVTAEPGQTSLDEILQLLQQAFQLSTKYLQCPNCDAGCPRLMNLAMLHQRQVTLLCELAKEPASHLANDSTRVALGSFQPNKEGDLSLKRLMLKNATRDTKKLVDDFHKGAKDFEDRYIAGTLILGEAGKLNLTWLLDVAANLGRRLDCVRVLLDQEDWASQLCQ
ncbi:hypothetical protein FALBO_12098 [Fusarium albosuccineum]|uniref:Zn(2)-C6 fungal-type domain-containing protein n=1 Tax=Fusarium albosuccineum TaxID=1237068 RepID=A0A8H4L2J6_9HYPO|nr:hypothetical protein FALBO_12098 [Fusarium albosuccineum]